MASWGLTSKLETDVEIKASAKDFHDMWFKKPHHVSNTCNDKVHGCDLHEGEFGKVGSIVVWHYTHDGVKKVAKDVIEAVDEANNSITFKVIEGDVMKAYKNFVIHIQATPKSDGNGCIVHWIVEYEKLHKRVPHPETLLQFVIDVSRDIDAHLTSAAKASSGLTGKLETDVEIKASAKDFHDMFMNKPHHVSNTCNDKVHGCDLHAGEWGKVGSIISWNYTHDGVKKVEKEVIEAVDEEKNSITFRVIEGDLMKEYKKFVIHVQATPKSNGSGCIAHWIVEYEKLHGGVAHPETFMQFLVDVSKDVDTHLCK
ncbi:hypothetical protein COLO4_13116 [Corchorus olitorius]|uniref:Bet v I/Major latex protein domain-containing protein n=1 Tax=Corchorus olitorius TaxID=93759 RepID=A0A1R3JY62_9ROSI|nr:hypothetical protein COLO4_13116 [Corchorus olitorius]